MKINKSRARDVEHGIVVSFARVVTLPIEFDGRYAVAYVGVTRLGEAASGSQSATDDDVREIARRLTSLGSKGVERDHGEAES